MYIPKRYGQSRVENCPFCGKAAMTESVEGVPVCIAHKNEKLPDIKCVCGSFLELRKGKFGAFFSCIKCGNVNFSKAMEVNVVTPAAKAAVKEKAPEKPRAPKETIVRSDELDFLY
jgi:ssDNA-binding Zn-finger/Zn-ribbon topoisomerase 1